MPRKKQPYCLSWPSLARAPAAWPMNRQRTKARIHEALEEAMREILRLEECSEQGAHLGLVLGAGVLRTPSGPRCRGERRTMQKG